MRKSQRDVKASQPPVSKAGSKRQGQSPAKRGGRGAGRLSRIEEELRASEERYRLLFEQNPDGMFSVDPEGRFVEVNPACERISGYTRVELLGKSFLELCAPDQLAGTAEQFQQSLKIPAYSELETTLVRRDGARVEVGVAGQAMVSAGRVVSVHCTVRDITQRKQMEAGLRRSEEQLRESEQRFRSVLENMSEGLMLFDAQQNLIYQNPASLRIHGFERPEEGQLRREQLPATWKAWDASERPISFEEWPVSRVFRLERFQDQVLRAVRVETGQEFFGSYNGCPICDAGGKLKLGFITIRDITERKRAETALRERDERFTTLLANLESGVALVDEHGQFALYNASFLRIFGLSSEVGNVNSLDWSRWQVFAENGDLLHMDAHPVRKAAITGKPVRSQLVRVKRPADDEELWLLVSAEPLLKPDGRLHLMICTYYDITERKQTEEALRLTQASIDGAAEMVAWFTPDGRVYYANEATCRSLGYSREELLQMNARDFSPGFTQEQYEAHWQEVRRRKSFMLEPVHRRKDGSTYTAEVLVNHVLYGGREFIFAYGRDITERKQAEAALRISEEKFLKAFAANPAAITLTRLEDGVFRDVNDTWSALMGYRREEVLGKPAGPFAIWPTPAAREHFVRELRARGVLRNWEQPLCTRSGQGLLVQLSAQILNVGAETLVLSTFVDITAQKEAQQVLARGKEELERLVAERTARLQELVGELEHFSYTITHDMRAPLRAMRGFTEVVNLTCEDCVRQEPKAFLRKITTSAERMDRLITDALDYSRSVRQELRLENVDTGALLRGMLDSYPELQPSKAHIRVEGELPVVLGNEAGLTQCFSNLLGNAVKFVRPGEMPEIRVWAEVLHAQPQPWVRIWVADQGIGIPQLLLPRVFDMFSRGSNKYDGTGIGLALVRKVVQRMGGRVGVESGEGIGSRFWMELRGAERL